MKKYDDWEKRVARHLQTVWNREFRVGESDCVTLTREFIFAATGVKLPLPVYTNTLQAARLLRDYWACDLETAVSAYLGEPYRDHTWQPGDVVLFEAHGCTRMPTLGFCSGAIDSLVSIGPTGPVRLRKAKHQIQAQAVWSLG